MAKNYMADVVKMLGVELGEEFKIEKYANSIFRIGNNGLGIRYENSEDWYESWLIGRIISGELEIIKLPYRPPLGKAYWYPNVIYKIATKTVWRGSTGDCAVYALGMCYKTQEEVEAHFAEDYKKLTGEELER